MVKLTIGAGERVVLAALVSQKWDETDELFTECLKAVRLAESEYVGKLIQRRGVSRSKKPGGAMQSINAVPMSPAYYLGKGKVNELRETIQINKATLCIVLNKLSPTQIERIEHVVGCRVISCLPC